MSKSEKKKFMRDANLTKEKFKQNRKQKTGIVLININIGKQEEQVIERS